MWCRLLVAVLSLYAMPAVAAEQCVTIPTTGWSQSEKNLRQANAYALIYEQTGCDPFDVPNSTKFKIDGDRICVDGCPDLTSILTPQTLRAKHQSEEAARAAAKQRQEADEVALQQQQAALDALDPATANPTTTLRLLLEERALRRKLGKP